MGLLRAVLGPFRGPNRGAAERSTNNERTVHSTWRTFRRSHRRACRTLLTIWHKFGWKF
jgi:hypothetical protein